MSGSGVRLIVRTMFSSAQLKNLGLKSLTNSGRRERDKRWPLEAVFDIFARRPGNPPCCCSKFSDEMTYKVLHKNTNMNKNWEKENKCIPSS